MKFFEHVADQKEYTKIYTALNQTKLCQNLDKYIVQNIAIFANGYLTKCTECDELTILKLEEEQYKKGYLTDYVKRDFCFECSYNPNAPSGRKENMQRCFGFNCLNLVWKPWKTIDSDDYGMGIYCCPECFCVLCGYCTARLGGIPDICERCNADFENDPELIEMLNEIEKNLLNDQQRAREILPSDEDADEETMTIIDNVINEPPKKKRKSN
jgi:hypothetical protein